MAMLTPNPSSQMKQMIGSHVWSSLESDDSELMLEARATHAPDGRKVDVKPILRIIDSILLCPTTTIFADAPTGSHEDKAISEEESLRDSSTPLRSVARTIDTLSRELICYAKVSVIAENGSNKRALLPAGVKMTCVCPTGVDGHTTTISLLKTVSNYSWDAKVLLTVAAFAVNYGEFFLLAQREAKNSCLSQSMALLKQLREFTERDKLSQARTEAIVGLLKAIMGVTRSIVDVSDLSTKYLNDPTLTNALAYIPKAAYWTILSVVVCASHVASCLNGFHDSTADSVLEDLSRLAFQGTKIQELLKSQLNICKEQIQEKSNRAYLDLVRISSTPQEDNMMFLKALFCVDEGGQYLVDRNNTQIRIEDLKGQHVLVLASALDLSREELITLARLYMESQKKAPERQYRIVWLPVVDLSSSWNIERKKFEELKSMMPWYMVPDPSKIKPEVIQYMKKKWQFENRMILVPIDPKGVEQSLNALDMLWIWGNEAFPFTKQREDELWETQTWSLKLLLGSFDKTTLDWIEGRTVHVCYYGGVDIDWIMEFTRSAKDVAKNVPGVDLQMVYVGKSNAKKEVQKIIEIIKAERLSNYFTDPTAIWFFWTRLESILYLKMLGGKNMNNDPIMREVTALLSYNGGDKGWALFSKGTSDLVLSRGDVALKSMKQLNEWKEEALQNGFLRALKVYWEKWAPKQQCSRIILPAVGSRREIPSKGLSTAGCECGLEKCFSYWYCVD